MPEWLQHSISINAAKRLGRQSYNSTKPRPVHLAFASEFDKHMLFHRSKQLLAVKGIRLDADLVRLLQQERTGLAEGSAKLKNQSFVERFISVLFQWQEEAVVQNRTGIQACSMIVVQLYYDKQIRSCLPSRQQSHLRRSASMYNYVTAIT